ncbi:hypothetical protein VTK26DRAFT_3471 [Humicola hyalothermophila]
MTGQHDKDNMAPTMAPALPAPYTEGATLTLNRLGDSTDGELKVNVKKESEENANVKPTANNDMAVQRAFLKLYDWRSAAQLREDEKDEPYSEESAAAYEECVLSGEAESFAQRLARDEQEDEWDEGHEEVYLAAEINKVYHAETAVYDRLRDIQGTMIPRLLAVVELNTAPDGLDIPDRHRHHFREEGTLLSGLLAMASVDILQNIVDQGARIASILGDYNVLNEDACPRSFMSRLRREDESELEWGRAKWLQGEGGAVGVVMKHRLGVLGKEIAFDDFRSPGQMRYYEYAPGEDD